MTAPASARDIVQHMMMDSVLNESHAQWCERFTCEIEDALQARDDRIAEVEQTRFDAQQALLTEGLRIAALTTALVRYGVHETGCNLGEACNCGLDAALKVPLMTAPASA